MHKTPMICSLLMAFGLSALMVGCEPAKMGTKPKSGPSTSGSTIGRGADVPNSKGAVEVPKAAEKPAEPAPKGDEAPKTDEAPKADAPKGDEPKADAPKADDAAKTEDAPKN